MCNERPKDRKLDEGRIFNTDPHSSKWYWAIWQKRTGCSSKNCHISDLYSTNCTQEIKKGRTKKWKTLWKVWNSTGKTGFKAGLLNFLHRVFNMWKNLSRITDCIACWMWKTFAFGKHCEECRGMLYFRMYQCQNIVKLKRNETMARLKRPALP